MMMNYGPQDLQQVAKLGGLINAARPPSLEQRLDHLQRALERLMKLRSHLGNLAERASVDNRATDGSRPAAPPSTDLSGRFGDTIGFVHANLDELEALAQRLDSALFEPATAQVERARG
jgi:hypothetical protein